MIDPRPETHHAHLGRKQRGQASLMRCLRCRKPEPNPPLLSAWPMSRLPGWVERVHSLLVSPYGVRFVGSTMRWIRQQSDRAHLVIGDELQMPIHDWSKVKPGTHHNFHQLWTSAITNQLNSGILPRGCFAMADHATVSSQRILYQCSVGNKLSANLGRIADRA